MTMSRIFLIVPAIGMSLFLQSPVAAQSTGRLSGTVEDAAGKVIPGARVTLTPREWAGIYSSTITSSAGTFLFSALGSPFTTSPSNGWTGWKEDLRP